MSSNSSVLETSSSESQSSTYLPPTAPEKLTAVFKVYLSDTDVGSVETKELVEWVHSLEPMIGLEIIGA
jgi:hypothetical protein